MGTDRRQAGSYQITAIAGASINCRMMGENRISGVIELAAAESGRIQ